MSSPAVVSSNANVSSISQQKPAGAFCSSISTTAKSTATTVTSASPAKKSSRKSETELSNGTNFQPIAPHQTFYQPTNHQHHHHQQTGIALASVQQQQQLQSSGVTVFSSPNMMTTQQQGGQTSQLVVNAQGQPMQTFNGGQGVLQGQGMSILPLPHMQMIQTAPGPTYTMPIQQFQYATGHNMQPIILAPGNLSMFQQSPSQLAIQIPNGNNTNTMITNQITTNAANTPVKPVQQQGQTIIKSVSMSPQQPQATKSSATTTPTAVRGQVQPNQQQQQTIIGTPTFQTTGTPNQTFVIGTFQSQPNGQTNGATFISTPNNNRKNNGTASSARSSSANTPKTSGANIIHQKIQPATSLATTPMIAPAQFKTNNSPFQTAANGSSPGSAQTIMVHGQGLQSGTGGMQLATNPTIISSFNNGLTWTTGAINQQQTQLVTPNTQPIYFRDGQMFFQTGNNQYQALPMQMTQGTQQQANTGGTMQMATGHQQIVASSVNQTMPMIQATHQTVAHASPMLQQTQQTASVAMTGGMANTVNNINNMNQGTVVSQSIITPTSTPMANASRQRPIRPASNSSTSSAGKQKVLLDSRSNVTNASPAGMQARLAPKNGPVASGGTPNSSNSTSTPVRPGLLGTQQGKLPLTMTKASDGTTASAKSSPVGTANSSTGFNNSANNNNSATNKVGQKAASYTPASSSPGTVMTSTSLNVSSSGTMMTSSGNSTPVNSAQSPLNRSTSPASSLNKSGNRKVEKKDSSTGTPTFVTKPIKSGLNGVRTSTGFTSNKSATPNTPTNSQLPSQQNAHILNGVFCQVQQTNPQAKTAATNQKTPNGTVSKSVGIGVQKGLSTPKLKPKQPEKVVLTHVIDGYVIQESPSPFPINGHSSEAENAQKDKDASAAKQESADDGKAAKSDSVKEATAANKDGTPTTSNGMRGESLQTATSSTSTATPTTYANFKANRVSVGCVNCGKKEMFKNGKDKMKKFCSAACNEDFSRKKALQNGTAPMAPPVSVMNKVMIGQPLMANSIMPQQMPSMPVAAVPIIASVTYNNLPLNNGGTPVAQMNGGLKRNTNLKESGGPLSEKKARVNSPLTVKNDAHMANNKAAAQQNGLTSTMVGGTDSASLIVKEDKTGMSELDGLWLPGNGKDPPTKWTVQDVYDFINNLEGCSGCADEFRVHEIDGQALMFINEEHIITILKMKLGPALKIVKKIKDLKSAYNM